SLVDSGAEAANAVRRAVEPTGSGKGETQYFVSDDPQGFSQLASLFLQEDVRGEAALVDISSY
ncbi:MAG: glutamate racemase, partial [Agathobaculum sp.]